MTDKERAKLYPIILSEYNPEWKEWFEEEKNLIEQYISKEGIVSITHIGSTSVEGLTAKPTVDILLEIPEGADIDKLKAAFPKSIYVCLDRQTVPTNDILVFLKGYTDKGFADKVFHIHVRYKGDWDEVYFRDYINTHLEIAAEYAALKLSLKDKFEYDRDGYTNAKGDFIAAVTKKGKNLTQLQITELASTEIENALKLVWEVFSEFEAPEYSEEGVAEFKRFIEPESFIKEFESGNIKIYGAKINGEIRGVIATRGISHICLLFVAKKYHKQGIAKHLFDYAEKIAVNEAKTEMTVNSSPYAVEVYKKLGFLPTEKEKILNGIKFTLMKKLFSFLTLRPLTDNDISLMERWLKEPHVAKWYKHPDHWLREIRERNNEFSFLTHFIAELNGAPIGFCQYYDCFFAQEHEVWNEEWHIGEKQGEVFSIDYLIGEPQNLRRGFGKQMIAQMVEIIWQLGGKRIIVEPEKDNIASNRVLESVGFTLIGSDYVLEN